MAARDRRPTLEMVAERAGVGRGTVSRVINGSAQVSQTAREAVRAAVDELGYVPNHAARTLVTRKTDTVALMVSEPDDRVFAEPFFARIVRGASAELRPRGLQLVLAMAGDPGEHEQMATYLASHHVDGVMLLSQHGEHALPARLAEAGIPCVHGGRPLQAGYDRSLNYVDIDDAEGARQATDHLVRLGRRRVATITGPPATTTGSQRRAGYLTALRAAGHPVCDAMIVEGDFGFHSGVAATEALLRAVPDVDAVFAASDPMALGALRALRDAGRAVPDDVAVVGFEDSPGAEHADPPLTTVHQPAERMGGEMARVLIESILDQVSGIGVVLDTHLVVRESA